MKTRPNWATSTRLKLWLLWEKLQTNQTSVKQELEVSEIVFLGEILPSGGHFLSRPAPNQVRNWWWCIFSVFVMAILLLLLTSVSFLQTCSFTSVWMYVKGDILSLFTLWSQVLMCWTFSWQNAQVLIRPDRWFVLYFCDMLTSSHNTPSVSPPSNMSQLMGLQLFNGFLDQLIDHIFTFKTQKNTKIHQGALWCRWTDLFCLRAASTQRAAAEALLLRNNVGNKYH